MTAKNDAINSILESLAADGHTDNDGHGGLWGCIRAQVAAENRQQAPVLSEQSRPVLEWLMQDQGHLMRGSVWDLLESRTALGIQRYGQALHSYNGRDALQDCLEEVIDAIQYAAQMSMEGRDPNMTYLVLWNCATRLLHLKSLEGGC